MKTSKSIFYLSILLLSSNMFGQTTKEKDWCKTHLLALKTNKLVKNYFLDEKTMVANFSFDDATYGIVHYTRNEKDGEASNKLNTVFVKMYSENNNYAKIDDSIFWRKEIKTILKKLSNEILIDLFLSSVDKLLKDKSYLHLGSQEATYLKEGDDRFEIYPFDFIRIKITSYGWGYVIVMEGHANT